MLPFLIALAAPVPPAAALVTAIPLAAIQRCMTTALSRDGRVTAINTASGVMLDFAFRSVTTDGRVAAARIAFAIDDVGTQRRITATAPAEADAALALQMLRETAGACIGDGDLPAPE